MRIDGACQCGSIRYEAEIDPETVKICYCTDCQALSGSAFVVVVRGEEKDFRLLSGKLATGQKVAESGNKREIAFCPDCSAVFYTTTVGGGPRLLSIRVGTVNQRDALPPKGQIWYRSAVPWARELLSEDSLPTAQGQQ